MGPSTTEDGQAAQSPLLRAHPRKPIVFYAVAAAVLVADQLTKYAIVSAFAPRDPHPIIPGVLDFVYVTNTGGAFGLMPWATSVLAAVAGLVAVGLIVYGSKLAAAGRVIEVSSALLLGGALGNLIDRARLGHVVDFVDLHFWPVFNIADIGITVGAALFIIAALRMPNAPSESTQE